MGNRVKQREERERQKSEKGSGYLIVSAEWKRYRQAIHLKGSDSSLPGVYACTRTLTHKTQRHTEPCWEPTDTNCVAQINQCVINTV